MQGPFWFNWYVQTVLMFSFIALYRNARTVLNQHWFANCPYISDNIDTAIKKRKIKQVNAILSTFQRERTAERAAASYTLPHVGKITDFHLMIYIIYIYIYFKADIFLCLYDLTIDHVVGWHPYSLHDDLSSICFLDWIGYCTHPAQRVLTAQSNLDDLDRDLIHLICALLPSAYVQ